MYLTRMEVAWIFPEELRVHTALRCTVQHSTVQHSTVQQTYSPSHTSTPFPSIHSLQSYQSSTHPYHHPSTSNHSSRSHNMLSRRSWHQVSMMHNGINVKQSKRTTCLLWLPSVTASSSSFDVTLSLYDIELWCAVVLLHKERRERIKMLYCVWRTRREKVNPPSSPAPLCLLS